MEINNVTQQNTNFNGQLKITGETGRYLRQELLNNKMLQNVAGQSKKDLFILVKQCKGHGKSHGTDGNFYKVSIKKVKEDKGIKGIFDKISGFFAKKIKVSKHPHSDTTILKLINERINEEELMKL